MKKFDARLYKAIVSGKNRFDPKNKDRANSLLRIAINTTRCSHEALFNQNLAFLIWIKSELLDLNAFWQIKILEIWINRFRKKHGSFRKSGVLAPPKGGMSGAKRSGGDS